MNLILEHPTKVRTTTTTLLLEPRLQYCLRKKIDLIRACPIISEIRGCVEQDNKWALSDPKSLMVLEKQLQKGQHKNWQIWNTCYRPLLFWKKGDQVNNHGSQIQFVEFSSSHWQLHVNKKLPNFGQYSFIPENMIWIEGILNYAYRKSLHPYSLYKWEIGRLPELQNCVHKGEIRRLQELILSGFCRIWPFINLQFCKVITSHIFYYATPCAHIYFKE